MGHRLTATEDFDATRYLLTCSQQLRTARKARGISVVELGKRVGMAESFLRAFLKGDQWTFPPTIFHLAHVLEQPPSVLFPDDPDDPLVRLLQRIAALHPDMHQVLTDFLDSWQVIAQHHSP